MNAPRCLSTYVSLDLEGYSTRALRRLSDGKVLPTTLTFDRSEAGKVRLETMTQMSISGVQDKLSLRLNRGALTPTGSGGQYILKPVPTTPLPRLEGDVPANESLTMQLAEQVFEIDTAANGLIRMKDGELAYLTRRFDRSADGGRIAQEDFTQLMERSSERHGRDYKYEASCEELATTLRRFCGTYMIEVEKLFRRIVFNYLVGNGDAHLKNFSLQQTAFGDYVLSPAYDLLCTRLHFPHETRMALNVFADRLTDGEESHGFVTGGDFLEFAELVGIRENRASRILEQICGGAEEIDQLIERSFLSAEAKSLYREEVDSGREMLLVYSRTRT